MLYQNKIENFENFILPSYQDLQKIKENTILYYLYIKGIYHLPTKELIEFLNDKIPDKSKTIEIGSGTGLLGKSLNIKCTDSHIQQNPEVKLYYNFINQPIIEYPSFVEKIEAIDAIDKYKPNTVVGCWVTQVYNPKETHDIYNSQSFEFGIDEEYVLNNIERYIFIGSISAHLKKRIFNNSNYKFEIFTQKNIPMISRALPEENFICIFEK